MLNVLAAVIGRTLAAAYSVVPSYAMAIILATVAVFATLTPLSTLATYQQQLGRRRMSQIKPDLDRLRRRHADDPELLRQETAALFSRHGINPTSILGGVVLSIVQAPVFIAVYRTIRGLGHLAHGIPDPQFVPAGSALRAAIVADNGRLLSLGLDLTASPATHIAAGVATAVPALALLATLVGIGLVQIRRSGREADRPKALTAVAFVSPLVALGLPSGLALYFVTSSLWRLAQTSVIYRLTGA